ncbi:MAG: hypothetical protein H0X30_08910 [Anaerolineae bacterium]|nr:hypothetical protein [Anaerolineae bacterium]
MPTELPHTDDATVMRMSIAWSIVDRAGLQQTTPAQSPEEKRKTLTQAYIDTYNAIIANEDQPKGAKMSFGN